MTVLVDQSLEVSEIAPAVTQTTEVTLQSAAFAAGSSASVNVLDRHNHSFSIQHTGSPILTQVEYSLDGTTWYSAGSSAASGNTPFKLSNEKYKFIRSNITTLASGAGKLATIKYLGGN